MAKSSPVNSPNQSRRESCENYNDNVDSPISPVSPPSAPYEAQSLLSDLLQKGNTHERQPLIKRHKSKDYHSTHHDSSTPYSDPELGRQQESASHPADHHFSSNKKSTVKESNCMSISQLRNKLKNPKDWIDCFTQPISYIPAVILGLLLNLLDAISYGMITFPLNNPIFASFGPDGISMFFVR